MAQNIYLVVWLKDYSNHTAQLHSDGSFYNGYFSMRGCHLVRYKTRAAAEKNARKWYYCNNGAVVVVNHENLKRLNEQMREDSKAVIARYKENPDLRYSGEL